ncbi:MAG: carbamoyltransferase HypF [Chloroflexi bacterium]|nr:carbamoyltransferase HypF [Chloroflexota bacterium]
MSTEGLGMRIVIRGIVQGVGFRPFIYNLATRLHLSGWVQNSSRGVEIEVSGPSATLADFLDEIKQHPPVLARIDSLEAQSIAPNGAVEFSIRESLPQPGEFIPVSPDVSICPDCQRELFDPADRRYRYPFINCTNCGPRFTIIQDIPYDRPNTTMAGFRLCPDCRREYEDPGDRRFHAQPIACPQCGPHLWFEQEGQVLAHREDALQLARQKLRGGGILAIKGLGGFHLACDASNPQAVDELRRRKRRSDKPFALMVYDLQTLSRHCQVSAAEAILLQSRQRPIVLLDRKPGSTIAAGAAPHQPTLGVMLPYTPLHLLLLEPGPGFPEVLVMTSGNLSEEPIAFQDDEARQRLSPLADGFLLHDRPIHTRVDDSVARIASGTPYFIRRSRGYAPDPIRLPVNVPPLLAAGAELKNTFCLARQNYAFVSHHIGDMENRETLRSFETGIEHMERLFHIQPELIACDLHPDYLPTRYALDRAERQHLPLIRVQHHHAHLAACLADNGLPPDHAVIGLCFDGTGLGTDGGIWGSEFLTGDCTTFQRRFHLAYTPLPGGEAAIRRPARMAMAHLWQAGIPWEADLPPVAALPAQERRVLQAQLEHNLNAPPTSSMGRLFDAISALLGIRQEATYEGQAAMELEALADPDETREYPFSIQGQIIDPAPVLAALLADRRRGISLSRLSARFHYSLVSVVAQACQTIRSETGLNEVALSGGVWQNRFLLEHTIPTLEKQGFAVYIHRQVPPNDGCISLGQAVVAASSIRI